MLFRSKEWNKAVVEFKKAVNLGIEESAAFIELGEIYSAKGFFEYALEVYQKAASMDKGNLKINMEIAEIYFKLNMPEKALYEYEALLEKQPSNIHLNLRLAQVYQTNQMFTESIVLLEKLFEDNPDNTEILYEIGKTHLYMDDKTRAREYFERTIKLDPAHMRAQVELSVLDSKKDPQAAIQNLKKMIQRSPTPDSFVYLSRVYIENNMIDQAIADFKVLTKTHPDSAPTFSELGKLYTNLSKAFNNDEKMRQSGLDALNKAVSLDENYSLAYFYLGDSYYLADNLEASLVHLKKAYQLDPQNLELKEKLNSVENQKIDIEIRAKLEEAKTFLGRGMDQNAIIEYEAILELSKFHDEANFDLASIYLKQNNLELARKYLQNALEKNSDFLEAYFELAKVYRMEANLNQAEIELNKVLARKPEDFEANLLMGTVLAEAEETSEAAIYLQKAIEINPASPAPLLEMGRLFLRLGEIEQTKIFFEKCYKLDASIEEVGDFFVQLDQQETRSRLEKLLALAKEAEQRSDSHGAKSFYEDILGIQPSHFYARCRSGEINEEHGKLAEAAFDYQQAYLQYSEQGKTFPALPVKLGLVLAKLHRADEAIPVLLHSLEIEPGNEDLHLTLVEQYKDFFTITSSSDWNDQSPNQVIEEYTKRTSSNPKSYISWLALGFCYRVNLANQTDLDPVHEKGIEAYNKAHNIEPQNEHCLYQLALLNHFTGKISKAKEFLKNLIDLNPRHLKAYERLATIYFDNKEYQEGLDCTRKLISLDPNNGEHRITLIEKLKEVAEVDPNKDKIFTKYKREFQSAVELNPDDAMAHFDHGYAVLTMSSSLSLSENDSSLAISEFKNAISKVPDNPWGYWGLKRVYTKESIAGKPRYNEAIDITKKALERSPEMARSYLELANALNEDYETNRKSEAFENYKKAATLDPDSVEVFFKLASLCRIRNQFEDSMQYYQRVIELDPTTAYAKDARRSLIHIEKSRVDV